MKVVIIDLETTGLGPEYCQVIEVGAVLFDTETLTVGEDKFRFLIKRPLWLGEAIGLAMNAELLKESEKNGKDAFNFGLTFRTWLYDNGLGPKVPDSMLVPKIVAAGKNFASFDLPFLKKMPGYQKYFDFHHRSLDPTMFFTQKTDTVPPKLDLCLERAGINKRTVHGAVDDCMLVAELLIAGFKKDEH